MKKILLILAASMLLFACGGNSNNKKADQAPQDPYAAYLDQAFEAVKAGDLKKADQLCDDCWALLESLNEEETLNALASIEKWYDINGDEFEALYEKLILEVEGCDLDAYGDDFGDYNDLDETYEDDEEYDEF
jgi:hypothetical protein